MKRRVAILASGGGSNAEALIAAMQAPEHPATPVLVFTNRPGAGVLARAQARGIPTALVDHRAFGSRQEFDQAVLKVLQAAGPDLLCLAGYLRILTPAFVEAYRGRILNIHPSLLPKFGGPGMHGERVHAAVLAAGEAESGASVHWVVDGVDQGPLVLQERVPVLPGDDAHSLAQRVLEAEHRLYPRALQLVCS